MALEIHVTIMGGNTHAVVEIDNNGVPVMDGDGANLIEDNGDTAWFVWDDFKLSPAPDTKD